MLFYKIMKGTLNKLREYFNCLHDISVNYNVSKRTNINPKYIPGKSVSNIMSKR